MKANRTSSNSGRHPYQKLSFWSLAQNQFWQTPMYSQESKDYFNNWLANWGKTEKNLVNIEQNIKSV